MTQSSEIGSVLDYMPYGLYIIGSKMDSECNGMMADWVMQVSFDPQMLAVAVENDAQTLQNIRSIGYFTLNFLSQEERSMRLAATFGQPFRGSKIGGPGARGVHRKLEEGDYVPSNTGCPILHSAMAWLECRSADYVPVGDHTLVISEVVEGHLVRPEEPLTGTFTGWSYSG